MLKQIRDVVAGEILSSKFQWISRESDVLIRVESQEYGKFLVLNELQLRYEPEMPRRMRAYSELAGLRKSISYQHILYSLTLYSLTL